MNVPRINPGNLPENFRNHIFTIVAFLLEKLVEGRTLYLPRQLFKNNNRKFNDIQHHIS